MNRLHELREQRAARVEEMAALNETAERENRDLADNERQRFDTLETDVRALDTRIQRAERIAEMERRAEATPLEPGGGDDFERTCRSFSLVRAIASQVPDIAANIDAGREREVSQELARRSGRPAKGILVPLQVFHMERRAYERRVITSTAPAGGPGGNLIPTDHLAGEMIDVLRARLIVQARGARVLSGLQGNVDIPRLKASAAAGWIAENAALTPSDSEFDKAQLTPKHVGALVEFSRNLLLQSSPDIETLVRLDFAGLLAEAIDRAATQGGGANEPSGILDTGGIANIDMSPATWEGVLQFIEAVELANASGAALGWATDPTVVRILRSTLKVPGDAAAGFIQEAPDQLAGYPLSSSTVVPGGGTLGSPTPPGALIFGDWSQLLVGYWGALEILTNPFAEVPFSKGNVQVRGLLTADVVLRHAEAFAAATDVAGP